MLLTDDELLHVEMTRLWTRSFRKMTKKHNVPGWRFDLWTVNMLKAIKAQNELEIKHYYKHRDGAFFAAINTKIGKRTSALYFPGGFIGNFAHTSYWDPDYGNYPDLTFIAYDPRVAFIEFETLFERFVQSNTPAEIKKFEKYVRKKYNP